ncbi:carbon-nitrogen hydrolase family protein [Planctomicrobium piriforme]|uniref:Predicted amidohydrolase n=1 Tax=Planctomicrobium piriforme TaxID=1576369 RepID=A0A1I3F340_9PLAN|nr:carbon-nitrogen hydrolase family protein [Planctomicrobium piriforme]SFI05181.1 Predicted amidohydrolase [Planctomicrobium piriforme]
MKIAVVQMDVMLGEIEQNLSAMLDQLRETRKNGAELTIFPECALTGYGFRNLQEAKPFAESIPGPSTRRFAECLQEVGGAAVFGMIEDAPDGIFNAAALVSAAGVIGSYRKIHLPYLGIDQYANYGDRPFAVHEYQGVRIGLSICYDSAFPESMRLLTLKGADLIVLPTNFPTGAEAMAEHVLRTRAMENSVYFACCNRIGEERGFRFFGGSQIIHPNGQWLARSTSATPEILYAEIDPAVARHKRTRRPPSGEVVDRIADRRPEMYGPLIAPHSLPRPGRDESK